MVTDQGNLVLDVKMNGGIDDPAALELAINNIPGVLENGLFVNLTDEVLVGEIKDGVAREPAAWIASAEAETHGLRMTVESFAVGQFAPPTPSLPTRLG